MCKAFVMRNVAFICLLMQILVCSAEEKHHPWLEAQPKETQEMVRQYGASEEWLDAHDRMYADLQCMEKRQREEKRRDMAALIGSIAIAFFPTFRIVNMVRSGELTVKDRKSVLSAAAILLVGAIVLFAFNYGIYLLRTKL